MQPVAIRQNLFDTLGVASTRDVDALSFVEARSLHFKISSLITTTPHGFLQNRQEYRQLKGICKSLESKSQLPLMPLIKSLSQDLLIQEIKDPLVKSAAMDLRCFVETPNKFIKLMDEVCSNVRFGDNNPLLELLLVAPNHEKISLLRAIKDARISNPPHSIEDNAVAIILLHTPHPHRAKMASLIKESLKNLDPDSLKTVLCSLTTLNYDQSLPILRLFKHLKGSCSSIEASYLVTSLLGTKVLDIAHILNSTSFQFTCSELFNLCNLLNINLSKYSVIELRNVTKAAPSRELLISFFQALIKSFRRPHLNISLMFNSLTQAPDPDNWNKAIIRLAPEQRFLEDILSGNGEGINHYLTHEKIFNPENVTGSLCWNPLVLAITAKRFDVVQAILDSDLTIVSSKIDDIKNFTPYYYSETHGMTQKLSQDLKLRYFQRQANKEEDYYLANIFSFVNKNVATCSFQGCPRSAVIRLLKPILVQFGTTTSQNDINRIFNLFSQKTKQALKNPDNLSSLISKIPLITYNLHDLSPQCQTTVLDTLLAISKTDPIPTSLLISFSDVPHLSSLTIYKGKFFARNNKGFASEKRSGMVSMPILNFGNFAEFLHRTISSFDFVLEADSLGETQHAQMVPLRQQKTGNCTIQALLMAVSASLYYLAKEEFGETAAAEIAKVLKKEIREFSRDVSLKKYLENRRPLDASHDVHNHELLISLKNRRTKQPERDRQRKEMIEAWLNNHAIK